jgi:hypothetical protein
MNVVYLLQHSYEIDGCDETKVIGIFSDRRSAYTAIRKLRRKHGFKRHPKKFYISKYTIGHLHWEDGFVTAKE